MKSVKKYVLSALMVAVLVFALCSCGSAKVEGTYVVYEYGGRSVDEVLEELKGQGVELTAEQYLSITLDENKNVTMNALGIPVQGTYEVNGDSVTLKVNDKEFTTTVKDGEFTWTQDNITAKLKKK